MLDFNYKDDIKYCLRGAKPLFNEHEDKFYCTPKNIKYFIQALNGIYQEYGWDYVDTRIAWGDRGVVTISNAT